ncbi:hypothetical protein [Malacoplasma penetrans]|nr:hypothetical protein [Malacoplasma penetrans]
MRDSVYKDILELVDTFAKYNILHFYRNQTISLYFYEFKMHSEIGRC